MTCRPRPLSASQPACLGTGSWSLGSATAHSTLGPEWTRPSRIGRSWQPCASGGSPWRSALDSSSETTIATSSPRSARPQRVIVSMANRRAADTEPGSMPGVRIATRGNAVQPADAGVAGAAGTAVAAGTAGNSVDEPLATAAISAAQCSHCQPVLLTGELDTWFAVVTVTRSPIATPNYGPT